MNDYDKSSEFQGVTSYSAVFTLLLGPVLNTMNNLFIHSFKDCHLKRKTRELVKQMEAPQINACSKKAAK